MFSARYAILFGLFGLAGCAIPAAPVSGPEPATTQPEPRPSGQVVTGLLGQTIASLGDPAQTGLWLETPLVGAEQSGRVTTKDGRSANLRLIPIAGEDGAGSRMSLSAYQALGLSPADLVPLTVTGT